MNRSHQKIKPTSIVLAFGLVIPFIDGTAQTRPSGAPSVFVEIAAELNVQTQGCASCTRNGNAAGPAVAATVGVTFPSGFGVAFSGRRFQEFSLEHTQQSKFLLVIGQYRVRSIPMLSVNVGAGPAWHDGDPTDSHMNHGRSTVVAGGAGLRLPATTRAAFVLSASVLKSIGGTTDFRPTTYAFGIGFGLSKRR